jgi:hypothetical protein
MSTPTPSRFGDLQHKTTGQREQSRTQQPDLFDYGQHAARTRATAAADARPKQPRRRDAIELHVASCGQHGATRQEIADALSMLIQSVCSPVSELLKEGRLRETERTRLTPSGKPAAVIVSGLIGDDDA